jgi:hypothetical protein
VGGTVSLTIAAAASPPPKPSLVKGEGFTNQHRGANPLGLCAGFRRQVE